MPRITGLAIEGGSGFTGRGRVVDCYTTVEAPPVPKEGQAPRANANNSLNWVFQVQPTDENGQPLLEEPKTLRANLGKKWNVATPTTPFHYAVGQSVDRNDPEPSYVGIEPGCKGNTIYVPAAGTGRPRGTAFDRLFTSLDLHIPQAAVDAMQCEEFIGMLADFVRKEEPLVNNGVPTVGDDGKPVTWSWPEVTAVIAMPNCQDFPGNYGQVQGVQGQVQTRPATPQGNAPVTRPATPPVRPTAPQVPVAQHVPVAQTPQAPVAATSGDHGTLVYNILNNCASTPGVFVQGTAYTAETLVGAVVPKIMTNPVIGGANPAQRQAAAQQFRNYVISNWDTLCAEIATHTGQKFMTDGAGSIYCM